MKKNLIITVFSLGADIESSIPGLGFSIDSLEAVKGFSSGKTFLVVGAIEPRKGHFQVLKAFENLWKRDYQLNLVFVGNLGWDKKVTDYIMNHNELNSRFFFFSNISDGLLKTIYEKSTCLIFASHAEGFGLPLVEAAQHKTPIILRDIPVFREIAEENGFYFTGNEPEDLVEAIEEWLKLFNKGVHPKSENMKLFTWKQSVEQLKNILGIS